MTKTTKPKKHNKLTVALLSPILMIAFIVGWTLTCIGQIKTTKTKQPPKPTKKLPTKQEEEFELFIIPQQEEKILAK